MTTETTPRTLEEIVAAARASMTRNQQHLLPVVAWLREADANAYIRGLVASRASPEEGRLREHSPLPWTAERVESSDGAVWWAIRASDGEIVANDLSRRDAEAIAAALRSPPAPCACHDGCSECDGPREGTAPASSKEGGR